MKKSMKKTMHECVVSEFGQASYSTTLPAAVHRGLVALQRSGFRLTRIKPAKAHQFNFCGSVERNVQVYSLISML